VVGPRKVKHEDARRTVPPLNTSGGGEGRRTLQNRKKKILQWCIVGAIIVVVVLWVVFIMSGREAVTHRISPKDWQGKAGGNLYWNGGCQASVKLLRGRVLFTIQARGTPAQGVWPHMEVKLDDEIIGERDVTSGEWKPYAFTKDVQRGKHTLSVYFTNDFHLEKNVGGKKIKEDRNLYVGATEITYEK